MKKSVIAVVAGCFVAAAATLPSLAGGKRVHEKYSVRAIPFSHVRVDDYYSPAKGSCLEGIEGVHKVSRRFKAPASGKLTLSSRNFQGDWDLYITDTKGQVLAEGTGAQLEGNDATEKASLSLRRGQKVDLTPCNWLGGPEALVQLEFVPKN
ncbi:MAG: hypothetical protein M3280_04060 [Actinomycetota bacterium]|nr:hypothetical protein [Actinomycetota bacterium]